MSELRIEKRKVMKIAKQVRGKTYHQYLLTVPKKFGEHHPSNSIYVVGNEIFIGAPNEAVLMKILRHIPEIEDLVKEV